VTAIQRDEAMAELELACECEHEQFCEALRQRDSARDIAVALEGELAALRMCLHVANYMRSDTGHKYTDDEDWDAKVALDDFINTGEVSDSALALASRLSSEASA